MPKNPKHINTKVQEGIFNKLLPVVMGNQNISNPVGLLTTMITAYSYNITDLHPIDAQGAIGPGINLLAEAYRASTKTGNKFGEAVIKLLEGYCTPEEISAAKGESERAESGEVHAEELTAEPEEAVVESGTTMSVHEAARDGNIAALKVIIDNDDSEKNRADKDGYTPVCIAAINAQKDALQYLLERGASREGLEDAAVISCNEELKSYLIENKICQPKDLLLEHIESDEDRALDIVIERLPGGIDVTLDGSSYNPLHLAAINGATKVINKLMQQADVEAKSDENMTAVQYAALEGQVGAFEALATKADLDVKHPLTGGNLLHIAAAGNKDKPEIVEAVVAKRPAFPEEIDNGGSLPSHVAALENHQEVLGAILDAAPHVMNKLDRDGLTVMDILPTREEEVKPKLKSILKTAKTGVEVCAEDAAAAAEQAAKAVKFSDASYKTPTKKESEDFPKTPSSTVKKKFTPGVTKNPALMDLLDKIKADNVEAVRTAIEDESPDATDWLKVKLKICGDIEGDSGQKIGMALPIRQYVDEAGVTLLLYAAYCGATNVVKWLLGKGMDAGATTSHQGYTALHLAAIKNHPGCVKTLMEASPVNTQTNLTELTALHFAVRNHCSDAVGLLSKKTNLKLETSASQGRETPLDLASFLGDKKVFEQLKIAKADITTKTLLKAIQGSKVNSDGSHLEIVLDILEVNAKAVEKTFGENKTTVLMAAAKVPNPHIFKAIADKSRDAIVKAKDGDGKNVLHHAIAAGHSHVIKRLEGSELFNELKNLADKDGNLPIHYVAQYGKCSDSYQALSSYTATALLSRKVTQENLAIKPNKAGKTALDIAAENGNEAVFVLLYRSNEMWCKDHQEQLYKEAQESEDANFLSHFVNHVYHPELIGAYEAEA